MRDASVGDLGRGLLGRYRTFAKYCMVGTFVTALDFAIFNFGYYVLRLGSVPAKLFAFSPSVLVSFGLNRSWTFRSRDPRIRRQLLRFLLVSLIGAGLSSGLIYVLLDRLHIHPFLANAMTCSVVLAWNFLANKYWTFQIASRPAPLPAAPRAGGHPGRHSP